MRWSRLLWTASGILIRTQPGTGAAWRSLRWRGEACCCRTGCLSWRLSWQRPSSMTSGAARTGGCPVIQLTPTLTIATPLVTKAAAMQSLLPGQTVVRQAETRAQVLQLWCCQAALGCWQLRSFRQYHQQVP